MTHTKEPWAVEMSEAPVGAPFAWISAEPDGKYTGIAAVTLEPAEANAARIVSCVNALDGLNPEAVADVVALLERFAERDDSNGDEARTALARIRGEG